MEKLYASAAIDIYLSNQGAEPNFQAGPITLLAPTMGAESL